AQRRYADLRVGLDLAIQLCHALDHAHSLGTVHGTLKPENVLLTRQGVPKLTDFGVPAVDSNRQARDQHHQLMLWTLMRGAAYVAPERWATVGHVTPQVDIFALGVCMYEVFCGHLPYQTTAGPRQDSPDPVVAGGALMLPERLTRLMKRCVS